jgi:hypothetical protein
VGWIGTDWDVCSCCLVWAGLDGGQRDGRSIVDDV